MTAAPGVGGPAALDRLATALGPQFITALLTSPGHRPHLAVIHRHTQATSDIYADDHGWYWRPHAERIAATSDPLAAAYQVAAALRGSAPIRGQR